MRFFMNVFYFTLRFLIQCFKTFTSCICKQVSRPTKILMIGDGILNRSTVALLTNELQNHN